MTGKQDGNIFQKSKSIDFTNPSFENVKMSIFYVFNFILLSFYFIRYKPVQGKINVCIRLYIRKKKQYLNTDFTIIVPQTLHMFY